MSSPSVRIEEMGPGQSSGLLAEDTVGAAMRQIYLGVLVIQPSPFCNINCDYCYLPDRGSTVRMDHDVLERVMDRIFLSGLVGPPFTILWHAGEPLTVPIDWYAKAFEIISRYPGASKKVQHSFQTNGLLLNQKWCDFIREHQIDVGLSIDGPADIHDAHRVTRQGKGTHAKAVKGAKLLQENEIPFGCVAVISNEAVDQPDEVYNFFKELGIDGVGFNIEEIEGENVSSSLDAGEHSAEVRVRRFLERVYELSKADNFRLRIREFETARQNILEPDMNRLQDGGYYNLETEPFAMINVDWQGGFSTFSPELLGQDTDKYSTFTFGNFCRNQVFEGTQHPAFQKVLKDLEAGNRKCAETCDFWSFCGGASPSNKLYENGSFDSAETRHCRCMIQMPMQIVLEDLEEALGVGPPSGSIRNPPPDVK